MMPCPKCGARTFTIDSRRRVPNGVRRRRACEDCKHRFTTIEITAVELLRLELMHHAAGKLTPALTNLLEALQHRNEEDPT